MAKGTVIRKKHPEEQNMLVVKNVGKKEMPMTMDDDKRASMTINKGKQSSHTPLYGISPVSHIFA